MNNYLAEELRGCLREAHLFDDACLLEGEVFREVAGRRTLKFFHNNTAYFVKLHFGVGWGEIFKNLISLRWPVLGAKNEWLTAKKLHGLGVDTLTPVAYASSGINPARIQSCIVTYSLEQTRSIEEMMQQSLITPELHRYFVTRLAEISAVMHDNGINHRDYYICHFLIDQTNLGKVDLKQRKPQINLIDLHRAQIRTKTPRRWRVKDIGGLLFSSADAGLSTRDLLRFIRIYSGKSLRRALTEDRSFWQEVIQKAIKLYDKDHGRTSQALAEMLAVMTKQS